MQKHIRGWACYLSTVNEVQNYLWRSVDRGMEMCQAWNLQPEERMFAALWNRWEEFWKFQANELQARYDMLKSFSITCTMGRLVRSAIAPSWIK